MLEKGPFLIQTRYDRGSEYQKANISIDREGIETARLNGKQIGGKVGSTYTIKVKAGIQEIIKKKSKSFDGSNNDSEVMAIINATKYLDGKGMEKTYHISNNTYYKYKRELIND